MPAIQGIIKLLYKAMKNLVKSLIFLHIVILSKASQIFIRSAGRCIAFLDLQWLREMGGMST